MVADSQNRLSALGARRATSWSAARIPKPVNSESYANAGPWCRKSLRQAGPNKKADRGGPPFAPALSSWKFSSKIVEPANSGFDADQFLGSLVTLDRRMQW